MADLDNTIKSLEHCYKGECVYDDGERCPYVNISGCTKAMLSNALELLKDQQPKKGEWIEREDVSGDLYYDCSVCGESWVIIDGTPKENGMDYCPHCGADMRKDGEQG